MELHREDRQFPMPHAFNGTIVKIDVGRLKGIWEGAGVDRKTMIFCRNEHSLSAQVANRLIAPMVPKFQFHGLGTARQSEDLMAETNPHDRLDTQALVHLLNDIG
jgi:hypothetical protein